MAFSLVCVMFFWAWVSSGNLRPRLIVSSPVFSLAAGSEPRALGLPDISAAVSPASEETPEITERSEAQVALDRTLELAEEGEHEAALEQLGIARALHPRLADRFAMIEGDIRMAAGPSEEACRAYETASHSPLRSLAARARVAHTRCLLAVGDRSAERALSDLRRSYPRFPQQLELELLRARFRERAGDLSRAVSIYRDIDLRYPGSPVAREARVHLAAIEAQGYPVRPLNPPQRLARVKRLARTGPLDLAYDELRALREMRLTRRTRARIALVESGMARREGRFDDARELLEESLALSPSSDAREMLSELRPRPSRPTAEDEAELTRRRLRGIARGRALYRLSHFQLLRYVQVAGGDGLAPEVNQALEVLNARRNLPSQIRLQVGVAAIGVGDDEMLAAILAPARDNPGVGLAARYYHARALERLGRHGEALADYREVVARDRGGERFYAFWAGQRVRAIATAREVTPELAEIEPFGPRRAPEPKPTCGEVAERLRPLAEAHAEAFPWLTRAVELLELGRRAEAADELHEVYLAWINSRSTRQLRTGLLSIYRGTPVPRHAMGPRTRRERRGLTREELDVLSEVAATVGDYGLMVHFGGWSRADERPRAYEDLVGRAAERHGVDPDLLLAVMRVESVYNPRIISYAGAVGLMQIMPRTGSFIARRLGREDFTVDQLLEPEVNIEFAAWYLASLLHRFDGRVPLAVASYNGGPHNVRLWIRDRPEMALDAFLETIPFGQTHRYVRRVLTHYEAYRNQSGEHVPEQALTLPELRADRVAF